MTDPTTNPESTFDDYQDSITKQASHSSPEINHSPESPIPLDGTTLAAVAGGGLAGAAIGQMVAGRTGATIGAVVGGVAGMAISHEVGSHAAEAEPAEMALTENGAEKVMAIDRGAEARELVSAADNDPVEAEVLAKTHYQIGVALGQQGDLEGAISEFQTTLDYAPESAETHYNLGVALSKQGQLEPAIDQMEQAKELCLQQDKSQGVEIVELAIAALEEE